MLEASQIGVFWLDEFESRDEILNKKWLTLYWGPKFEHFFNNHKTY